MDYKEIRPLQEGQKTACVVRYGAWGDAILVNPVLRQLKKDGFYVVLNCTEKTFEILKRDPNVDLFAVQKTNEVPVEKLDEYYKELSDLYDKFVNLNGSIEMELLKAPFQPEYYAPKEERHQLCNTNYNDHTMWKAGYPTLKGELPELFFKENEEEWAQKLLKRKEKKFFVLVCLTGSSPHKVYPYMGEVVGTILDGIPEAEVILVGEGALKGTLEPEPRLHDHCGEFGIRKSFLLTKHVDLVVSTETSVAMAAGCFDTPKVVMLSHGTEENLTKYWKNCHAIAPKVSCYPCHQLHYDKTSCKLDQISKMPICAALLHPKRVLDEVEKVYKAWKEGRRAKE